MRSDRVGPSTTGDEPPSYHGKIRTHTHTGQCNIPDTLAGGQSDLYRHNARISSRAIVSPDEWSDARTTTEDNSGIISPYSGTYVAVLFPSSYEYQLTDIEYSNTPAPSSHKKNADTDNEWIKHQTT